MATYRNDHIRDLNSKLLLECLIQLGPVSRAALARQTGLTKATVSAIIAKLISDGLVTELGSADTSFGRKPILLSFQRQVGFFISIDLGSDCIRALAADFLGDTLLFKELLTPPPHLLISSLAALISSMQEAVFQTKLGLCGIALGIHGITFQNQIIFTPHYAMDPLPIAEELRQHFQVPVLVENEANLAVLGEYAFLAGSPKNIVDLSIHTGVGAGLLLDGKLYTGSSGRAGEFGHTIIYPNGKKCACGRRGCLEQYLSLPALLSDYKSRFDHFDIDYPQFCDNLRAQKKEAIDTVDAYLFHLALCINNIVQTYNPELIIITDSLLSDFPWLLEKLHSLCHYPSDNFDIRLSKLGRSSSLYGGIHQCALFFLGIETLSFSGSADIPS